MHWYSQGQHIPGITSVLIYYYYLSIIIIIMTLGSYDLLWKQMKTDQKSGQNIIHQSWETNAIYVPYRVLDMKESRMSFNFWFKRNNTVIFPRPSWELQHRAQHNRRLK